MQRVYERAAQLRPQRRSELIDHLLLPEHIRWLSDGQFAYATTHGGAPRHVLVDPRTQMRSVISPETFTRLDGWLPPATTSAVSPTGASKLIARDFDLWLQDVATNAETRLTDDGEAEAVYGVDAQAGTGNTSSAQGTPLIVRWSPDGRFALTQRTLVRNVRRTPLLVSSPRDGGVPQVESYIQAFPGDADVPLAELLIVDTVRKTIIPADIPPLVQTHSSPLLRHDVWWDASSRKLFALHSARDWLTLTLYAIDPSTGQARLLLTEQDTSRVRPAQQFHQRPNVVVLTDEAGQEQEIVWYSLRDGWGHLYLYDAETGDLVRQLTSGECGVEALLRVDAPSRTVWASMSGLDADDPYRRTVCMVDLAAGGFTALGQDGRDHRVVALPSIAADLGYLDWASTVAEPPRVTLRSWMGDVLIELEHADLTRLEATGWQRPMRFATRSADGTTTIYGTLFLPPDFDPTQRYPVVDHVYPGPQRHHAEPYFSAVEAESLAALGLVAVMIDGRGTPGRSRAFHLASWRNIGAAGGIEDHVAALKELAQTRSWLDLTRVGVVGHSAGGFAVTRAMELFPDVYTVGVAQSGRHDGRLVMAMILEAYDGPPDEAAYARASAVESAGAITGKLLLIHGEMDRGVPLAQSLRVVDRMITANRDVDLIVLPGDDHIYSKHLNYVERRTWDYLVRHLLHKEPPPAFLLM
jgi:dipeptidyl aminopeptidase/acylaminoacyl peptidase